MLKDSIEGGKGFVHSVSGQHVQPQQQLKIACIAFVPTLDITNLNSPGTDLTDAMFSAYICKIEC